MLDRVIGTIRSVQSRLRDSAASWLGRLLAVTMYLLPWAVLGYVLYANWEELSAYSWSFSGRYLTLSLLSYTAALCFGITMWSLIMRRIEGTAVLLREARIYVLSSLLRRLPLGGVLWQVGGRLYLYREAGLDGRSIPLATMWEMVAGLSSSLVVWVSLTPFASVAKLQAPLLSAVAVLVVVLLAFPGAPGRAFNWVLGRLGRPALPLDVGRWDVLSWSAVYALDWVAGGFLLFFFIKALDPALPWRYALPVVGTWAGTSFVGRLASFLPIKLGVGEVVLSVLLNPYIPLPKAVAISVLFRIWVTAVEAAWAIPSLLLWKRRTRRG